MTDDLRDTKDPWTQVTYFADNKQDTCSVKASDSNCNSDIWWTKYRIQDEKSGLHLVQFAPTEGYGAGGPNGGIYYR